MREGVLGNDVNTVINRRNERRAYFEQRSGFNVLTQRQKEIIFAIEHVQDFARSEPGSSIVERFQKGRWCHASIHALETEAAVNLSDISAMPLPADFFAPELEYKEMTTSDHIRRIKEYGYPCIVLFRQEKNANRDVRVRPTLDASIAIHTVLVTGENGAGDVRVWHTDGAGPFQEESLSSVIDGFRIYCEERGFDLQLGLRNVRCLPDASNSTGVIKPQRIET